MMISPSCFVFPLSACCHSFETAFSQKVNTNEIVHEKQQTVNEFKEI